MIMVSGMCGTGKSTFAGWLGERLGLPVINYDRFLRRIRELCPEEAMGKGLPYQLFLFQLEEHMGCDFIADYIFSVKQEEWLRELTEKHGCKTVNIHFDCQPQTAYGRYTRRNSEDPAPTRPDVTFEQFEEATRQNRDFLWGDLLVPVDSEDFRRVSYEEILHRAGLLCPQNQP